MLRFLRIRNLAVIETADVEFDHGFSVLTGETGAGKSILIEAVGLLLGARGSTELVRTGEKQASIEAIFDDDGSELVVRREITSQGRSRSFVNGALATSSTLRELATRLVELHGQHEHQALLDPTTHLGLLDEYGSLELREVGAAWETVAALREQLDRAGMDARERAARLELIAFQLTEIERVAPKAHEDDELIVTRQVLASAERLRRLCDESYAALYDRSDSVLTTLSGIRKRVGELAAIEPRFSQYVTDTDDVKSQLEDLAFFIRDYGGRIDASPERLQAVEERLAAIERLKRKHGPTLAEVLQRWQALSAERELLSGTGERAADLRGRLDSATAEYLERARAISAARRRAAVDFARDLERLLAGLAMERTRVEVRFADLEPRPQDWNARGIDDAELYVSPNPGEDLRPLARIVSGGELSRLMLALKTLGARRAGADAGAGIRTLIFDEVDAGIGGRVADVVGEHLQNLGRRFQVLCVTHLPQIAARAATQFRITKAVRGGRTSTMVEPLDAPARVDELSRMMAGATVTEAVRSSARELLARSGRGEAKGESESPRSRRK
jgi:DNA repair protein RecN (Recombination protein N)